jgi:hypothetical protein
MMLSASLPVILESRPDRLTSKKYVCIFLLCRQVLKMSDKPVMTFFYAEDGVTCSYDLHEFEGLEIPDKSSQERLDSAPEPPEPPEAEPNLRKRRFLHKKPPKTAKQQKNLSDPSTANPVIYSSDSVSDDDGQSEFYGFKNIEIEIEKEKKRHLAIQETLEEKLFQLAEVERSNKLDDKELDPEELADKNTDSPDHDKITEKNTNSAVVENTNFNPNLVHVADSLDDDDDDDDIIMVGQVTSPPGKVNTKNSDSPDLYWSTPKLGSVVSDDDIIIIDQNSVPVKSVEIESVNDEDSQLALISDVQVQQAPVSPTLQKYIPMSENILAEAMKGVTSEDCFYSTHPSVTAPITPYFKNISNTTLDRTFQIELKKTDNPKNLNISQIFVNNTPITGHVMLSVVHSHPDYVSSTVTAQHITDFKTPNGTPIVAWVQSGLKNGDPFKGTRYIDTDIQHIGMAHSAIINLKNEHLVNIVCPMCSTDEKSKYKMYSNFQLEKIAVFCYLKIIFLKTMQLDFKIGERPRPLA